MAESIVDKIKAKLGELNLPFLKKKASAEAEDPDYNKANKKMDDIGIDAKGAHTESQGDKTNPGIAAPVNEEATESNNLEDIKSTEKPKMVLFRPIGKTKFTPVHVLVVLGLAYFGMDFLTEEEPVVEEVVAPKPKKKNRKKKNAEEQVADASGATPPAETPSAEATPNADATASLGDLSSPSPEVTPEVTTSPTTEEKTEKVDVSATEINLDVNELNAEAVKNDQEAELKAATETKTEEASALDTPPALEAGTEAVSTGENVDTTTAPTKETDLAQDLLKNLSDGEEVKDAGTKELKQSGPPEYTRTGRGLVYNCKDGHWACISKDEYATCKANRQWNEKNSKKLECYEISVYATDKDCSTAQRIKVDSVAQTDFCK